MNPTQALVVCSHESFTHMELCQQAERSVRAHQQRHPVFVVQSFLWVPPGGIHEPPTEALTLLERLSEEVRVVRVPIGGCEQLHADATAQLPKLKAALLKKRKVYAKKSLQLQGMDDLTDRISQFRTACHKQLAIQRILQEDVAHCKKAMKAPCSCPSKPDNGLIHIERAAVLRGFDDVSSTTMGMSRPVTSMSNYSEKFTAPGEVPEAGAAYVA